MSRKLIRVIYNAIRFLGSDCYRNLLAVETSTHINKSKEAKLKIGKKFRTRFNIEINARDRASVVIGNNVFLNSGCIITSRERISIGDNTILGPNVIVFDNDHKIIDGEVQDNTFDTQAVTIGQNVWIGAGTIILKGSIIEDGSIVAAGSVVKGKVEKETIMIQKRITTELPLKIREGGIE